MRQDGGLEMRDKMGHAAAALRALAAAAKNLARRDDTQGVHGEDAGDRLADILGRNDVTLTDDHALFRLPAGRRRYRSVPRGI